VPRRLHGGEEVEKEACFIVGLMAIRPEHQHEIADRGALRGLVSLLKRHVPGEALPVRCIQCHDVHAELSWGTDCTVGLSIIEAITRLFSERRRAVGSVGLALTGIRPAGVGGRRLVRSPYHASCFRILRLTKPLLLSLRAVSAGSRRQRGAAGGGRHHQPGARECANQELRAGGGRH